LYKYSSIIIENLFLKLPKVIAMIKNIKEYPLSTHAHIDQIKKLYLEDEKSEEEIADILNLNISDVTEATVQIEIDNMEDET